MSKYVKELMMDQLRSDLDGSRSLLILDLKDLDANAEHQLPPRLAQEVDPAAGAQELAGPPCLHRHGDGWTLEVPRWALGGRLGRRGDHRAGQGDLGQGQESQEARNQGRGRRRRGRRPGAGRRHHQAAQPRGLDRAGDQSLARAGAADARAPVVAVVHRWSVSSKPWSSGSKARRGARTPTPPAPAEAPGPTRSD